MSINSYVVRGTVVSALGGLLFGFDTAVISGTTQALTDIYRLSPVLLGITVFSALLGTVIAALGAGIPGQRFGRRDSLRAMAIFYVISALGCAFAWNWTALIIFRFIGGLGIGGSLLEARCILRKFRRQRMKLRPLSRIFPAKYCRGHSPGLFVQLHHRDTAFGNV